jgi:predicted DNA-binding antitoxin AbrB/MazE fold protein
VLKLLEQVVIQHGKKAKSPEFELVESQFSQKLKLLRRGKINHLINTLSNLANRVRL